MKIKEGLQLIKANDLFIELTKHRLYGSSGGFNVGFHSLKEKYTWGKGTCTDWTGHPTSGKTQLVLEFAINVSISKGVKHLLYMPDLGSNVEIIADLIHKYIGKTFDKRYKNYITEQEISKALIWVNEHFILLDQKDLLSQITPFDIWQAGIALKEKGVTSVIIDSWKDFYHNIREYGREDLYLAYTLKTRNKLAERYGMHFHTVIHPTKPRTDANGNPLPPTAYDLKGGSEWFNNAKSIIVVNRPDKDDNVAEIDIRKVKPRALGKTGKYFLKFDMPLFRYYEEINGKRHFAFDYLKNEKIKETATPQEAFETNNETDKIPF